MTACAFRFGATVPWEEFPRIADRLRARGADSAMPPPIRCDRKPGEQLTMIFLDPSGNPIGLEAFHDPAEVIAQ